MAFLLAIIMNIKAITGARASEILITAAPSPICTAPDTQGVSLCSFHYVFPIRKCNGQTPGPVYRMPLSLLDFGQNKTILIYRGHVKIWGLQKFNGGNFSAQIDTQNPSYSQPLIASVLDGEYQKEVSMPMPVVGLPGQSVLFEMGCTDYTVEAAKPENAWLPLWGGNRPSCPDCGVWRQEVFAINYIKY